MNCCVQVALRIRPLSDAEMEESATVVAHRVDQQMVVLMDPLEDPEDVLRANRSREKTYMFDVAFDFSNSQEEVYRATTKGLIEGLISGYNATVFAYGPTGCGKTYTMLGTDKEPGIYVRTLNDLFRAIEETSDDMLYSITMSYLEIYNEMIRDLLNPSSGFLDLREDSKGEIQVAGITEVSTINAQEIMELLVKGNRQRTQEPTAANQTSSRSHAVLQVSVRQQSRSRDVLQEVRYARLFMIDLAGSERAAQTQNRGQRLKEGAHINRSLLALGNCINALSDKTGPNMDSKLTRLLKDSLGGNSRTVMIAHISPASSAFEESRNTLAYAHRAKSIRTRVKKNLLNVTYHIAQYTSIISELRGEIQRLQQKISEQDRRQSGGERADIRSVQAEVQALSSHQSRAEVERIREQLLEGFREQMEIRRSLMELENSNMEIQVETSRHLLTIADWEQERSRRRRKWRAEQQKESESKEESEKDSDSSESAPDSSETQEVSAARENLLTLMSESKRVHRQKASLERRLALLREQSRRVEELLPRRVSCEGQRQVLGLLCKVHELEVEKAEMQSSALLKDNLLRHKEHAMQRFERHRLLCDQIIQKQRQFIHDHSLLVPPQLQELYDVYMKEADEWRLERAMALDKTTASLPRISLPLHSRDQDLDSDQESVRTVKLEPGPSKTRRHTLPPILPQSETDSNRVFKSSPHAQKMKSSSVMTPPPIHINGSSHLDSSPDSSEAGVELTHTEREQILKGVQSIVVKAARRRSRALESDAARFPPPSPLRPHKQRSSLSPSTAPPAGPPLRRRQPSPELTHATSDDNLSSSTGDGAPANGPKTQRGKPDLSNNHTPRERESEGRRRKRRSRSFEAVTVQRFRPLDSTSDPHLHIGQLPPPRAQRGAAVLGKGRGAQQTGVCCTNTNGWRLFTLRRDVFSLTSQFKLC
uniref:Kinesin-like protein n=1 Tax=Neogobius melanostomus TaxID=47308 RepID=A0A8C6UF27_9GOBI